MTTLLLGFLLCSLTGMHAQPLQEVKDFGENPGNLKMFVHLPPSYPAGSKVPLVVVLHGCTQSAGVIAAQTGWNKLADEYGFVVVYPQQRMINNPEMCFCWYRRKDITKGRGEDLSIIGMTDYAKKQYNIDSSRVFITGLSAGALMSVVLMSTYPETFCSGAIFAGGAYKCATNPFTAWLVAPGWVHKSPASWGKKVRKQNPGYTGNYPRMIIYQGKNDLIVNRRNGFEIVKQWTNLHHIDTIPAVRIKNFAGNKDVEKDIFRDANNRDAVVYYKVNRLGHAYLINPGSCISEGGKRGIFSKDKNYHATWWTAVDFGLTRPMQIEGHETIKSGEQNLVYSVPFHAQSTYLWSYPDGCTVVGAGGTNTIILNWGQKGGNLNVLETDAAGCRYQYTTLFVSPAP
jgi:poly(hydroxyalkanoate) depolymerase family esterase